MKHSLNNLSYPLMILMKLGISLCWLTSEVNAAVSYEASGLAALEPVAPVVSCEALKGADFSKAVGAPVRISGASVATVKTGSICRVTGVINPNIRFEVQLPTTGWTQRYLQGGCGGLCGNLRVSAEKAEGCVPVDTGAIVLASTDMGHQGPDGSFGADPQLRIDFAYRGVHVTALAAKAIIKQYYGRAPKYSYFTGCSDGGREALVEVQRFPNDFNGVAAGAPAMNFQVQNSFYHAWQSTSNTGKDGKAILTAAKLPLLHGSVVETCDALDGLKDGQIDDPRLCKYDPKVLLCAEGKTDTSTCLTAAEVDTVRKLYDGPRTASGQRLTIGGPQPGSELSWKGVFVPNTADQPIFSSKIALDTLQGLSFVENPAANYAVKDFAFDEATFKKISRLHGLYDATNPDISPFTKAGGKLILWHGWSDPHISPINTIAYYQAVQKTLGETAANAATRLFLFPGMYHCGGGDGPGKFDVMTPLMQWVEKGNAPSEIMAERTVQADVPAGPPPVGAERAPAAPPVADRTRPVFAYPMQAKFGGKGSLDQAANFTASKPSAAETAHPDWLGSTFYTPGFQHWCSDVSLGYICKPAP